MKVATIFTCFFLASGVLFAQAQKKSEKHLDKATITVEEQNIAKKYFKFTGEVRPSVSEFISEYRSAFALSDENELRISRQKTDELGQTHYRYKQYYNGLELFDIQFLVHVVNGTVKSANG
jgi:Zn-dependent metalloprotease